MPSDAALPARDPVPDWKALLAIGLDRLRDGWTYAWYFGLGAALQVLNGLAPAHGPLNLVIGVTSAVLSLYASLILARQLMTGRLEVVRFDARNLARLLGATLLLSLIAAANLIVALIDQQIARATAVVLFAIIGFYVLPRMAFYIPALALNDPTSIRVSFVQGRLYWGRILAVLIVVMVAGALVIMVAGLAASALQIPRILERALVGWLSAAAELIAEAAVCYLYWKHIRFWD